MECFARAGRNGMGGRDGPLNLVCWGLPTCGTSWARHVLPSLLPCRSLSLSLSLSAAAAALSVFISLPPPFPISKPRSPPGVRIGPPPDLPSLLLHNRIVYIGMPLVPAVTELIIAELLYLNYESTADPITMYINSSGTTTATGQSVGFETEAFAIADVMKYVRPPVHTVALGQAFGAAAMLLAQGKRGRRSALPNATILLNQPKSMARGQASDIAIKAREVAANRRTMCELLASACQKPVNVVEKDCQRVKYLQPHEAVEYGLIDRVVENEKSLPVKPSFISQLGQ